MPEAELEFEPCEAILQHACDADYGDVWQCDLPIGHEERHHSWAALMGDPGGDGFDADCVELYWHQDNETSALGPH